MIAAAVVACSLAWCAPVAHVTHPHPVAHVVVKHALSHLVAPVAPAHTAPPPNASPEPELMPPPAPEDWNPAPALKSTQPFTPVSKKGRHVMFTTVVEWFNAFIAWAGWGGLVIALVLLYYVAKHGPAWVKQKATSIWNSLLGDFAGFKAAVSADIAVLKADVSALKTAAPAPAPAPTA